MARDFYLEGGSKL